MEKEIQYRYAVTGPNDDLVNIKDVTEECRVIKYRCLGCNRPMSFVLPDKHPEHQKFFRHQRKCDCDSNNYLHALAERKIKERFDDKKRPFLIKVPQKIECSTHCELFNASCMTVEKSETINLRKHYDTCTLEKKVEVGNGKSYYVTDLKLHHLEHPEWRPVLIEIFVTHENSESKRNSGLPIIEVNISPKISEGEKDIERFCSREIIEEDFHFNEKQKEVWDIRMDGFNLPIENKPKNLRTITRVQLFSSGKFLFKEVSCAYLHKSLEGDKPLYEFNMIGENLEQSGFNDFAYIHLKNKGYATFRDCTQCNHYRKIENVCSKSETTYAPKHPFKNDATYCPYFELAESIKDKYNNTTCQIVEVSNNNSFINTELTDALKEEKWKEIINHEYERRRREEEYEEIKRIKEQEKKDIQNNLNLFNEKISREETSPKAPPKKLPEINPEPYILEPSPDLFGMGEDYVLESYYDRLILNTIYFNDNLDKRIVLDKIYSKKSKCIYILSSHEKGEYYAIYKITFKKKFTYTEKYSCSDYKEIKSKFMEYR